MNFPHLVKLSGITFIVLWIYYRIQFRRWFNLIRLLALYSYEVTERTIHKELIGESGLWALEVLYFYKGSQTGYLIKFEIVKDPKSFTNTLMFSYWIAHILRHTLAELGQPTKKIELFNYMSYVITSDNRNLSHYDTLITK